MSPLTAIQDPIVPKVGFWGDVKAVLQPKNWAALRNTADEFLKGNGLDVSYSTTTVQTVC
jgi:hypothetical protein